jgi:hypothetical protein
MRTLAMIVLVGPTDDRVKVKNGLDASRYMTNRSKGEEEKRRRIQQEMKTAQGRKRD